MVVLVRRALVAVALCVAVSGCLRSANDWSTEWYDPGLYEAVAKAPSGTRSGTDRAPAEIPVDDLPSMAGWDRPALVIVAAGSFEITTLRKPDDWARYQVVLRQQNGPDPKSETELEERAKFYEFAGMALEVDAAELDRLWLEYRESWQENSYYLGPHIVLEGQRVRASSFSEPCSPAADDESGTVRPGSVPGLEARRLWIMRPCVLPNATLWFEPPRRWIEDKDGWETYQLVVGPNDVAYFRHDGLSPADDEELRRKLGGLLEKLGREAPTGLTFSHTQGD